MTGSFVTAGNSLQQLSVKRHLNINLRNLWLKNMIITEKKSKKHQYSIAVTFAPSGAFKKTEK